MLDFEKHIEDFMNVALIIAGGVGSRVGADKPKQFINVLGKPVLAYTLESFNKHSDIDRIELVCISSYIDDVMTWKVKYSLDKLEWIIEGGNSAQESIYNGIKNLEGKIEKDDIVIIHDGVRPIVDDEVISDVIAVAKRCGNGVTSLPYNEQIFIMKDEFSTEKYIPRETLRRVSTPQAYIYKNLLETYEEARKRNIGFSGSSYANTLFADLGRTLYFAKGSDKNIKLTTKDDFRIFTGYLLEKDYEDKDNELC